MENVGSKVLSVIIPVFNLRDYLGPCMDSILSQGVDEDLFEIILVDDGSTDGSTQVMEDYSSSRRNISLLRKSNGGVSSARNAGVTVARGKYITFLDADDCVGAGSLAGAVDKAGSSETDVVIMRILAGSGGREKYPWKDRFQPGRAYSPKAILAEGYFRGSACSCLFLRSTLISRDVRFQAGLTLCEDTLFMSECMADAGSIEFADIPFYAVTEREGSASRSLSRNFIATYGAALESADRIIKEKKPRRPEWLHYCKYQIIIRLASVSASLGVRAMEAAEISSLRDFLPVDMSGIPVDRGKIRILNISYPLFQLLIKIRDRRIRKKSS